MRKPNATGPGHGYMGRPAMLEKQNESEISCELQLVTGWNFQVLNAIRQFLFLFGNGCHCSLI